MSGLNRKTTTGGLVVVGTLTLLTMRQSITRADPISPTVQRSVARAAEIARWQNRAIAELAAEPVVDVKKAITVQIINTDPGWEPRLPADLKPAAVMVGSNGATALMATDPVGYAIEQYQKPGCEDADPVNLFIAIRNQNAPKPPSDVDIHRVVECVKRFGPLKRFPAHVWSGLARGYCELAVQFENNGDHVRAVAAVKSFADAYGQWPATTQDSQVAAPVAYDVVSMLNLTGMQDELAGLMRASQFSDRRRLVLASIRLAATDANFDEALDIVRNELSPDDPVIVPILRALDGRDVWTTELRKNTSLFEDTRGPILGIADGDAASGNLGAVWDVMDLDPNEPVYVESVVNYAKIAADHGHAAAASATLRQEWSIYKDEPTKGYRIMDSFETACVAAKDFDLAEQMLDLPSYPPGCDMTDLAIRLAEKFRSLNRPDDAKRLLRRAESMANDIDGGYWNNPILAQEWIALGDKSAAERLLRQAIISSNDGVTTRGLLYYDQCVVEVAIDCDQMDWLEADFPLLQNTVHKVTFAEAVADVLAMQK